MPIVFIHGVAVRADGRPFEDWWRALYDNLRRYIAPVVSKDHPERVTILPAYWGDLGGRRFWWDGASRPLSALLGKGAEGRSGADDWFERAIALAEMPETLRGLPREPVADQGGTDALVSKGAGNPSAASASVRLKDLTPDQLAALTMAAARSALGEPRAYPAELLDDLSDGEHQEREIRQSQRTAIGRAVDSAAHQKTTLATLAQCADLDSELAAWKEIVGNAYQQQAEAEGGLVGKGVPEWIAGTWAGLKEAVGRAESAPGYLLSKALTEFRRPANDLVTLFMGDVFAYIDSRTQKDPNRNIALRVLDTIVSAQRDPAQAGEPLVLLTHSMGGQIAYDLITEFLPRHPEAKRLRVDFWCATASQVGLFEEMKRFLASTTKYSKKANNQVPYPSREQLGVWWNVWDSNDFISYTARPVFVNYSASPLRYGVIDEEYPTGRSVLGAHSGYLEWKSFFVRFAQRLREAESQNWWRP